MRRRETEYAKKDKIQKNILEKNRKESKVNEKYIVLGFY